MKVLIIGSGGREHAIAWKIRQSPICEALFVSPGNAGTAGIATNLPAKATDFEAIKAEVLKHAIDIVIVGPDDPLALGIVDFFRNDAQLKHVLIMGPTAEAAQLEASKAFAKAFMQRHHIPTASYRTFTADEQQAAYDYVMHHPLPVVIKADGLAAGKGVAVCTNYEDAKAFLDEIWQSKKFGKAGDKVVVESFLDGVELSVFILTDGKKYLLLPEAKDYKRIGENDEGPNTGGMGSISPVPFADAAFMDKVKEQIIAPTLKGLQEDSILYQGFIFFGLINVKGDPFVIEYNARMGDPETQSVFPRIKSDMMSAMLQVAKGELEMDELEIDDRSAASVILVSGGYPEAYESNKKIEGLNTIEDSIIFHAGTKIGEHGNVLTSGGRVLAVTSLRSNPIEALAQSYEEAEKIHFDKMYFRKDIGQDLLRFGK
jgi:phosphoribosylamine--glycine ligase